MNEQQLLLFNDLTPLQKEIALNSVSGMNDIDAYKASKGKAVKLPAMEASVSEILSNLKVVAFIESMNAERVNKAIMSREEMMEELTLIARTNTNDLIEWDYRDVESVNKETGETEIKPQSYWTMLPSKDINPEHMAAIEEVSTSKEGLKFKRTSKLVAMKQLAEIGGYNSAAKFDHSSSDGTMTPPSVTYQVIDE